MDERDLDLVVSTLQEHLAIPRNDTALACGFEGTNDGFVKLKTEFVVKQYAKGHEQTTVIVSLSVSDANDVQPNLFTLFLYLIL